MNQANNICLVLSAAATLLGSACRAPADDAGAKVASDTAVAAGTANTPGAPSKEITNSIGMKLMLVPKGEFAMGSARGNRTADCDERQHVVTITRDCCIGAFEVAQAQFEQVMGRNLSQFQCAKILRWRGRSFRR